MNEGMQTDRATIFSRVLGGLLRPLVRALIAQGITAPAFYRLIKRIYVDVAVNDFPLEDGRQTDSRVSILTGVHRRDVRDFRAQADDPDVTTADKTTTIATVMGRWLAGPGTIDKDGTPLALPRSGDDGISFETLVRAVSKDVRPRTVLDEMVRQKLVEVDPDAGIVLRADAFLGPADMDQRVHFFAENVGDHIAAAVDNLLAEDPRFMERAVFYNRLTPASVDAIETEARALGTDALVHLNRLANEHQAQDLDAPDGTHRFRFGMFFYRMDEDEASVTPDDNDKKDDGASDES